MVRFYSRLRGSGDLLVVVDGADVQLEVLYSSLVLRVRSFVTH